eukprot:TRINITY_DN22446_c0_g1_i1.p1 TRINITY_DN22446_c0_g1~~TRINITY_DN22446_c0_g1_i1.p1  ORF type:complete len:111 (-),score=17.44 TRINITY_DN22446_c0_g1_i1:2825-3157(-)
MPWRETMQLKGCKFRENKKVIDFLLDEETGCISEVVCEGETYSADAVVLAIGISPLQSLVMGRYLSKTQIHICSVMYVSECASSVSLLPSVTIGIFPEFCLFNWPTIQPP